MANAISEAFKLVKANLWRFPMTEFQEKISLTAMQEGFATVSENMAKAISEAF